MGYRTLRACVQDLERHGHLVRITEPVDAHLEAAELHRRVFAAGGPAILFENVVGCSFPMVSNLFGTRERTHFIFRDTLASVRRLVQTKADPARFATRPWNYLRVGWTALSMLPRRAWRASSIARETSVSALPQMQSWPEDGGAFITLPQVYTEDPNSPGLMKSNLGMYRVQLSGNDYATDRQVGMHYQIHRSIGVHHAAAVARGEKLRVNIFVGGPPAMTVAAVMPLPEGMSELTFAGALAGHRMPMSRQRDAIAVHAEADFCIQGTIDPDRLAPEGPFGDHLGYYSLVHDFPVLEVEKVYHRPDPIWPFTVVGRPPQEDTMFGDLIHDLTGPVIPTVLPGIRAVNAVDESGVHPLLLAIGSERYTPYRPVQQPQELLTQANAILGQGQMSLAKYLFIVAGDDDPDLDIHDIESFFVHVLARVDWTRDLHFQTRTTIDTLDYSGSGFNEGSKLVVAAAGPIQRQLPTELGSNVNLPAGFHTPRVCFPGVLAISGPEFGSEERQGETVRDFSERLGTDHSLHPFPLITLVDDSEFTAQNLRNWLWVTFTRSNPAADIGGVGDDTVWKHWGCSGPLVIDARIKPHHAPPLIEDPGVTARIDELCSRMPLRHIF